MSTKYYRSLDGLRAFAVLFVLAAHAGSPFPKSGGVGVDIFFVLSGFLITSILVAELRTYGQLNFRNFYARRFLRLSPCLILTCALVILVALTLRQTPPWASVLIALTYTANWARAIFDTDLSSLAHCWSLAIEEQYYLVWPFAIVYLERMSKNSARNAFILLAAAVVAALYRASLVGYVSPVRIYFALDTHLDGLILGGSLAYVVRQIDSNGGLSPRTASILGNVLTPLAIAVLCGVMYRLTWWSPWMGRLGYFLVAAASAVLIADLTMGKFSLIRATLEKSVFVYTGRISYSLYLLHLPLFHTIDSLWPDLSFFIAFPLKILVAMAVATLSYFLIEVRFLSLKKYFVARHEPSKNHSQPLPEKDMSIVVT